MILLVAVVFMFVGFGFLSYGRHAHAQARWLGWICWILGALNVFYGLTLVATAV